MSDGWRVRGSIEDDEFVEIAAQANRCLRGAMAFSSTLWPSNPGITHPTRDRLHNVPISCTSGLTSGPQPRAERPLLHRLLRLSTRSRSWPFAATIIVGQ